MAEDIDTTTSTAEQTPKRGRGTNRRGAARKMVKPMRSIAIFGAVGALVAGVVPGAGGEFRYNEGYVLIQMEGSDEGLELPVELASHIFLVGESA